MGGNTVTFKGREQNGIMDGVVDIRMGVRTSKDVDIRMGASPVFH
jgi:hypothetical protein